jgi:hypothetical protein
VPRSAKAWLHYLFANNLCEINYCVSESDVKGSKEAF